MAVCFFQDRSTGLQVLSVFSLAQSFACVQIYASFRQMLAVSSLKSVCSRGRANSATFQHKWLLQRAAFHQNNCVQHSSHHKYEPYNAKDHICCLTCCISLTRFAGCLWKICVLSMLQLFVLLDSCSGPWDDKSSIVIGNSVVASRFGLSSFSLMTIVCDLRCCCDSLVEVHLELQTQICVQLSLAGCTCMAGFQTRCKARRAWDLTLGVPKVVEVAGQKVASTSRSTILLGAWHEIGQGSFPAIDHNVLRSERVRFYMHPVLLWLYVENLLCEFGSLQCF